MQALRVRTPLGVPFYKDELQQQNSVGSTNRLSRPRNREMRVRIPAYLN